MKKKIRRNVLKSDEDLIRHHQTKIDNSNNNRLTVGDGVRTGCGMFIILPIIIIVVILFLLLLVGGH